MTQAYPSWPNGITQVLKVENRSLRSEGAVITEEWSYRGNVASFGGGGQATSQKKCHLLNLEKARQWCSPRASRKECNPANILILTQ